MDPSHQAACTHKEDAANNQGSKNANTEQSTEPQPDTRVGMDENVSGEEGTAPDFSEQRAVVEKASGDGGRMTDTDGVNKAKDDNGMIFYTCRFCGLTFNYMTTLRAHERVHNVDQPYKCNKCSEAFHFMCELEYHAKQHSDQKGYKCECGRSFHNYTDLLYHKHPGEDEGEEAVVEESPAVLLRPGQRIPETEFPVPGFVEKGYEPKHPLKVYSDVRSKPYICQYCSKSYADSRGLSYHMSSHRGERAFTAGSSRYLIGRSSYSYISPVV